MAIHYNIYFGPTIKIVSLAYQMSNSKSVKLSNTGFNYSEVHFNVLHTRYILRVITDDIFLHLNVLIWQ